jgi:hypothetical protein
MQEEQATGTFFLQMLLCIKMRFVNRKQCDPSHHRPARSSLGTPTSATPSNRSARFSCISSARGSQGSISPQSSLGDSFNQSPIQGFVDRSIAPIGQSFPSLPTPRPSLSPPEYILPDTLLTDSDLSALSMQDIDQEVFQWADMELESWNTDFTTFPPADYNSGWNSQEDLFVPNYSYIAPIASDQVNSGQQDPLRSSPHVIPHANDGQNHDRKPRHPGQLIHDAVHSHDFDIDQWLLPALSREDHGDLPTGPSANSHKDTCKDYQSHVQDSFGSRDQDYVLFPDSPQFDWGLEPHQISQDIGSKYSGVESGILRQRYIDANLDEQDLRTSRSGGISKNTVSRVQSTEIYQTNQSYLPSPSASDGSEDYEGTSGSDCSISGTCRTVNDGQDTILQNSNHAQSFSQGHHRYEPSYFSSSYLTYVFRSIIHRTTLGDGHINDGRTVVTAASPLPVDQELTIPLQRPQGQFSDPMPVSTRGLISDLRLRL